MKNKKEIERQMIIRDNQLNLNEKPGNKKSRTKN